MSNFMDKLMNGNTNEKEYGEPEMTETSTPAKKANIVFEDLKDLKERDAVIDEIQEGRIVLVNLKALKGETKTAAIEYITGACYVLHATIKEVNDPVYLITPHDVGLENQDVWANPSKVISKKKEEQKSVKENKKTVKKAEDKKD